MSTRKIAAETWALLLSSYRELPALHIQVSQRTGLDVKTCRKAWTYGIRQHDAGRPIQQLILEEQVEARASLLRDEQEKRDTASVVKRSAREHAVRTFAEEGEIVDMSRTAAGKLLKATRTMLEPLTTLAERARLKLQAMLEEDAEAEAHPNERCPLCDKYRSKMDMNAVANMLDRLTNQATKAIDLAHKAMQMERLHLGRPETIIGVQGSTGAATVEEATKRLGRAAEVLESAARRGVHGMELPPLVESGSTREKGKS